MIINSLKIRNFGIYTGEHIIDFRSTNDTQNVILIGGMNGRGKTTILDSILLALYGKRSISFLESGMSYTEYLRKFINKFSNEGDTFVELSFNLSYNEDKTDIKIRRSWNCNKTKIVDSLEIWRNSILDKHLAQNWATYIEELLPSGIASLFFFDGERISRLAEEETNEEMKKSIKTLLGIDTIDRLIVDLKRVALKKESEISYIKDNDEINNLKERLDSLNKEYDVLDQHLKSLKTKKKQVLNWLEEKESEFFKKGGTLGTSRSELLSEKDSLSNELAIHKGNMIDLAGGALPLLLVKPLIEKIFNTVKEEENIKSAKHVSSFITNLEKRFLKNLNTINIEDSNKVKLLQFFKDEINKIHSLENKKEVFDISPIGIQQFESLLLNEFIEIKNQAKNVVHKYNSIEQSLDIIERHLSVNVDENESNKLLKEIKNYTQKITNYENEINLTNNKIEIVKSEKKNVESALNKILQKIIIEKNSQDDAARIVKYSSISIEVMEAFKQNLQVQKVQKLSEAILDRFKLITHKKSLLTNIHIDPSTLNFTLCDSVGGILLKSQLSAGEKQMLAISMLWGLAESSGQSLPIIIDTPMSRLDSSHRTNFITQYLPNASNQVIVLSTEEEIYGKYLEMLEKFICRKYLLKYDDERKATNVVEGYFQGEA